MTTKEERTKVHKELLEYATQELKFTTAQFTTIYNRKIQETLDELYRKTAYYAGSWEEAIIEKDWIEWDGCRRNWDHFCK
jgi:hypothetical protein